MPKITRKASFPRFLQLFAKSRAHRGTDGGHERLGITRRTILPLQEARQALQELGMPKHIGAIRLSFKLESRLLNFI